MPELDTGRLIRHARDLIDESKKICERSRRRRRKKQTPRRDFHSITPRNRPRPPQAPLKETPAP